MDKLVTEKELHEHFRKRNWLIAMMYSIILIGGALAFYVYDHERLAANAAKDRAECVAMVGIVSALQAQIETLRGRTIEGVAISVSDC